MKKMIVLTLSAALTLSLAACGSNKNSAEIPDPFTECKTMEEASQLVGFDVMGPDTIDDMDKTANRVDADKKLIEVIYTNDDEKLTIRKAEGSEDVSGDYTKYSNTDEVFIGDTEVTMKGDGNKVNAATWLDGSYTYSITTNSAMERTAMTDLINATGNSEADMIGSDPATWGPELNSDDNADVESPNPFAEYASMADAEKAAGFSMKVPSSVDNYTKQTILAAILNDDNSMIEVIYQNDDENAVRIRKATGSEDISGDYTQYAEAATVTIGERKVTMKGQNGQINLATWTDNGYTYSIGVYSEVGISSEEMTDLIAAVQ